jgi:hypothetical protein
MNRIGFLATLALAAIPVAQAGVVAPLSSDAVYRFYSLPSDLPPEIAGVHLAGPADAAPLLLPSSGGSECGGDYCGATLNYTLSATRSVAVTASTGQAIQASCPLTAASEPTMPARMATTPAPVNR